MTRLLNTPIMGPSAKTVASSWIDMLAGLSGEYIFKIPPDFCANAGPAVAEATRIGTARAIAPRYGFIFVYLPFESRRPLSGLLRRMRATRRARRPQSASR